MQEIIGDIWKLHSSGKPIVITTNGEIKKDGTAIMGRGIALDAKNRYPLLPLRLAQSLRISGNHVKYFEEFNLFTFPTKYSWRQNSDIQLIERSLQELLKEVDERKFQEVYLVRPGCSNGGLNWSEVKPIVSKYLDDRFIVVNL